MSCCSACGKHACACGCGATLGTPLSIYNRPGLDSLAWRVGAYADFRATMQDDLSDAALPALAGLRTRESDDPSMALLDAWAVTADVLSFYAERIANEGYLRSATERRSVLELAGLVDYRLRPGVAASVYLAYTVEKDSPAVTVPAGAAAQSIPAPGEQMQTFETAEPLDARFEWNALKPRLSRPQSITRGSLETLGELRLEGTANNLKPDDWLVFEFADGRAPAVRQVREARVDLPRQSTQVSLQAGPSASVAAGSAAATVPTAFKAASLKSTAAAESGFVALVDALQRLPTVQPANATRLPRSAARSLGVGSDVRPQLLLNFQPRIAGAFYAAWSSTQAPSSSAQVTNVYVQRVAAARFGYNAPWPTRLVKDSDDTYQSKRSALDIESEEVADTLYLDNAYDGILPGSHVIVRTPSSQDAAASIEVRTVTSAAVHPHTAYGLSGKSTQLVLQGTTSTVGSAAVSLAMVSVPKERITGTVRVQQIFARSERLTLAEALLSDEVGGSDGDSATRLPLDTTVDGLKAGRWVIVAGQRSDVPGTEAVSAAELVMLSAVEQSTDAQLPGDTVHSTLVFANKGLAYRYRRDSVTVNANVVRATHGQTRREVLGSGNGASPMQTFGLKQKPLTWVSAATPDGMQSTLELRVNDVQWHETGNLAFVGRDARSFVTVTDDNGATSVRFGDGTHGARLPTGVENIKARYRNGIGAPGNVVAGQISLLATKPLGVKEVVNPLRASGGADAESRDQARRNVPLAVLALDRLVSVADYADLARTFGGVGKAVAVATAHGVQVTIAGAGDAPVDATSDLHRNLLDALQRYGDPSLPVRLREREWLALTMSAKVGLAPDYAWELVEPVVRAALLDAFGFDRRALGQQVWLSEAVACMQAVRGVAWVDIDVFDRIDQDSLLAGFSGDGQSPGVATLLTVPELDGKPDPANVGQRLLDRIKVAPYQIAYLSPTIPDTLLLQEAMP